MSGDKQIQIVEFMQAKCLYDEGFNWWTHEYYLNDGSIYGGRAPYPPNILFHAPTVALALKWVRDVKKINACIHYNRDTEGFFGIFYSNGIATSLQHCDTYEEAESHLLDMVLSQIMKERMQ